MDHVEDVTPSEFKFSWLPNSSIDELVRRNLVALAVVEVFNRHAAKYGMTLTKLLAVAGAPGKTYISAGYNDAIELRYLARVELTYQLPEGGRPKRYTWHGTSRVPMSDETFTSIVKKFTRGGKVLLPLEDGEVRRVKVLAAEIYCHLGARRIEADGALTIHENARGRAGKKAEPAPKRPQPQRRPRSAAPVGEQEAQVSVEVEIPTSTLTCGNSDDPQVDVEVDDVDSTTSTSNKKTTGEHEPSEHDGGRAAAPRTPAAHQLPVDVRSGLITELESSGPLTLQLGDVSGSWRLVPDVDGEIERQRLAEYDAMEAGVRVTATGRIRADRRRCR